MNCMVGPGTAFPPQVASVISMRRYRALLLYEEQSNSDLLRSLMAAEGYQVDDAPLGTETAAPADGYCLVLFDIQRLTAALLEMIRIWRDYARDTTLIVLGSRAAQPNRVALLEAGVDAYFIKPVIVPELRARLRATLRRFRSQDAGSRSFSFGARTLDLEARVVRAANGDVRLTPTEYEILEHLALHLNQTVPSSQLVKTLWGDDPQKGVHSLRLFIRKLRRKLEPDPAHPRYLVTDQALGYRLQVQPKIACGSVDR